MVNLKVCCDLMKTKSQNTTGFSFNKIEKTYLETEESYGRVKVFFAAMGL